MRSGLDRLLRPGSIAVVGGGNWCENAVRQARMFGFDGPVWPVHPYKSHIAQEVAYPSVAALPAPPDATFIGVNRHATIETVRALAAIGAGGAVCFASGFLEAQGEIADGPILQRQLLTAAGDMTLLGPNCYGFVNYLDGTVLWPDQQGGRKTRSGVAIVSQSSNIAINITMQRRALPLAYMVTAGNQAQTGLAKIGAALLDDPRVSALGLHIEGVGDIRALEALAEQARGLGKPIVALKVGHSVQARAATVSHTASLAGSAAGSRALLERLGIAQAGTLPEFLEALKLLHVNGPLPSGRLVSMSCSGGEASLMADLAHGTTLSFPALNSRQNTDLRAVLGRKVKLANPLDYHTYIWNDTAAMADTFSAAMDPSVALGIVVSDFPRADRCDPLDWDCVVSAVDAARTCTGTAMAIAASLPENMPENVAQDLIERGITPFCGLQEALGAARIAAACYQPAQYDPVLLPVPPANLRPLSEPEAKAALAKHGLTCPTAKTTQRVADLPALAKTLNFPLVLKGLGHAHKSEAGAVHLNLTCVSEVADAAARMQAGGYLLEEMVRDVIGELLIGVALDPAHGYVLTLGAGGVLAELIRDTASLLIPATRQDIETALKSLNIYSILQGYRGKPGADIPAVIDAVLSVQAYVIANHGHLSEIEINPLLALASGAIAADALIITGDRDDR